MKLTSILTKASRFLASATVTVMGLGLAGLAAAAVAAPPIATLPRKNL